MSALWERSYSKNSKTYETYSLSDKFKYIIELTWDSLYENNYQEIHTDYWKTYVPGMPWKQYWYSYLMQKNCQSNNGCEETGSQEIPRAAIVIPLFAASRMINEKYMYGVLNLDRQH